MPPSTQRLQQIATMYSNHHDQLRAVVYRRGSQNLQVVEDACSHAWTQLLATEQIDVRPPRCVALGWVTTTAVRHAWMLGQTQRRATATVLPEIDTCITERGHTAPASDELVAQHLRLDLVTQIPERPRRFLLRLALGYSYAEIAAAEHASATTTNKQIARAKRILRDLEQNQAQQGDLCAPTP
jgi:DNA-directed RNA polymerase specialized sigma24 family protein